MPQRPIPHPDGLPQTIRMTHTFDFNLMVRGRRRSLRLRQCEVARAAGVGREWLVEFEHGKPTMEFGKVFAVFQALGLNIDITPDHAPQWTRPLTDAAKLRRQRLDALRHGRPRIPRPDLTPPKDWPGYEDWEAKDLSRGRG